MLNNCNTSSASKVLNEKFVLLWYAWLNWLLTCITILCLAFTNCKKLDCAYSIWFAFSIWCSTTCSYVFRWQWKCVLMKFKFLQTVDALHGGSAVHETLTKVNWTEWDKKLSRYAGVYDKASCAMHSKRMQAPSTYTGSISVIQDVHFLFLISELAKEDIFNKDASKADELLESAFWFKGYTQPLSGCWNS